MAENRSKEKDTSSSFERIGFEDAEMGSGIGHIVTDVTQEMDRERAAIIIQHTWRGHQCRNLLKLHKAAVKIQATWYIHVHVHVVMYSHVHVVMYMTRCIHVHIVMSMYTYMNPCTNYTVPDFINYDGSYTLIR